MYERAGGVPTRHPRHHTHANAKTHTRRPMAILTMAPLSVAIRARSTPPGAPRTGRYLWDSAPTLPSYHPSRRAPRTRGRGVRSR
eukprot:scaffold31258_cov58-Phaeocystis_antarctica.AAC.3